MLENLSDYISFGILMAFPIMLLMVFVYRLRRRRKAKLLANQEKYYREW